MPALLGWTDYPIRALGDTPNQQAPIRQCAVIAYDGDKYADVVVANANGMLAQQTIKIGYVYSLPGRCGEVPVISLEKVKRILSGDD